MVEVRFRIQTRPYTSCLALQKTNLYLMQRFCPRLSPPRQEAEDSDDKMPPKPPVFRRCHAIYPKTDKEEAELRARIFRHAWKYDEEKLDSTSVFRKGDDHSPLDPPHSEKKKKCATSPVQHGRNDSTPGILDDNERPPSQAHRLSK